VKLVLASFNRDKLRELRELLGPAVAELVSLDEFPGAVAPPETGTTLLENALAKAGAAMTLTGLPAIGDDTGLEVDALGGRPGIHAARFAGPGASYADNRRRLLEALVGVEPARRTARFRAVCAACFPGGPIVTAEGVLEGRITEQPRGSGGFGYDPLFELPDLGRTLAELTPAEKNRLSHRARAIHALAQRLVKL
jgi:XTP/dITP diphosphohydrolase